MIISRGDRSHGKHYGGDEGCGEDCIETWKRGEPYVLDTKRCRHLRLEILPADVRSLFYALTERYQQPAETLKLCAEALTRLATMCQETAEEERQLKAGEPKEMKAARRAREALSRSFEELQITRRVYTMLKGGIPNIKTIGELAQQSEARLLAIRGFGRKSLQEVREALASRGLSLREEL